MSEGQSTTHTAPGEGESVWLVGNLIGVKLSAEDTGGAFSMIEEGDEPAPAPAPRRGRAVLRDPRAPKARFRSGG